MKAPPELVARFETASADLPGATRRQMFGYPAAFANGHMFAGLHQDRWVVRLPEEARTRLIGLGGTPFEPMPGRPMREYVVLPPEIAADATAARAWLEQSVAFVLSLPPKPGR